jgi:hypothetical protein
MKLIAFFNVSNRIQIIIFNLFERNDKKLSWGFVVPFFCHFNSDTLFFCKSLLNNGRFSMKELFFLEHKSSHKIVSESVV